LGCWKAGLGCWTAGPGCLKDKAQAMLKFTSATVIGNVKEIWYISLFPLATEVIFGQFCGHFH
jgi:hypothetical protein